MGPPSECILELLTIACVSNQWPLGFVGREFLLSLTIGMMPGTETFEYNNTWRACTTWYHTDICHFTKSYQQNYGSCTKVKTYTLNWIYKQLESQCTWFGTNSVLFLSSMLGNKLCGGFCTTCNLWTHSKDNLNIEVIIWSDVGVADGHCGLIHLP